MAEWLYIYGVTTFVMCIITIIGNVMTIVVFQQERSLTVKPSNLLILALSMTDLIYGTYILIYYGIIAFGLGYPYGELGCMVSVVFENTFVVSNILLVCISLDRVILVTVSYSKYVKLQTVSRIRLQIAVCCCIGALSAVVELSLWNFAKRASEVAANIDFNVYCLFPPRRMKGYGLFFSIVYFCIPCLLVTLFSMFFFARLRTRMQNSRKIGDRTSSNAETRSTCAERSTTSDESGDTDRGSNPKNRYLKPAITLAALVASMSLSRLPYCLYTIIVGIHPQLNKYEVIYIMLLILQLSPLLDPLFYAASQRLIQDFYKRKFTKLLKCIRPE